MTRRFSHGLATIFGLIPVDLPVPAIHFCRRPFLGPLGSPEGKELPLCTCRFGDGLRSSKPENHLVWWF